MFDLKWIRENPDAFDRAMRRRGLEPLSERVLDLDARRREAQTRLQEMQSRRNAASKEIGQKKQAGDDAGAESLKQEVGELKQSLADTEERERELARDLDALLSGLPNAPAEDVPDGEDESANVVVRSWGETDRFAFTPRQHFELGESLAMMDFEDAAKLAGSRFVVLRGGLARLHRAIAQFMIDVHVSENGYEEVVPPFLVNSRTLYGTGQLPKFGEDLFQTAEGYWLIPTAEVPLANLAADKILDAGDLPQRYTALTPCFRAEAGAAGKDTRGMLRQHQFEKVELVSITHPDRSWDELARMTGCAEDILRRLEIPYRVVTLSAGDMGFAAMKTHDIEVWLPGQGLYREISSCSNCGPFQALRMHARFREPGGKATAPVHTLNGSGVAVGRALIAVVENHQRADGTIAVPAALQPYMGGVEAVAADG